MKIAIVKLSSLGDVVHTFPVVTYLRRCFPEAQIDWFVGSGAASLVESHPEVDRAIIVDPKRWSLPSIAKERYDLLFDLQGNLKSAAITGRLRADRKIGFARPFLPEWPNALVTRERFSPPPGQNIRFDYLTTVARALGDPKPPLDPSPVLLRIGTDEQRQIDNLLLHPHLVARKIVLVSAGSAWRNKCVTYDALIDLLKRMEKDEELSFIWIWGSEAERQGVEKMALQFWLSSLILPKMSLPVLQNLMARVDQIVAMDSLPLHLAGTTGTPTFSVFGPSSSEKYRPIGPGHLAIQGRCPYNRTFELRCPKLRSCSTGLCTRGLTGDDLYQSIQPPPKTRSPL